MVGDFLGITAGWRFARVEPQPADRWRMPPFAWAGTMPLEWLDLN